jgi:hypothetical protein
MLSLAVFLSLPAIAMADLQLAEEALSRMASVDMDNWHYTRHFETSEGSRVDSHNPTLPGEEHWQLISEDGAPPSNEDLDDYAKNRTSHVDDSVEFSSSQDIIDLILPGSMQQVSTDSYGASFSFRVRSPNGKKKNAWASIAGEFHVSQDMDGPFVDKLKIWNTEPFYPRIGVHMSKLLIEGEFITVEKAILPGKFDIEFSGRAWLVMKLEEVMKFRLEQYRLEPPEMDEPSHR